MRFDDLRVDAEIFNKLNQIAAVVTLDGRILAANKAAQDAYGYSQDALSTMTLAQLRHQPNHNLGITQLENAAKTGTVYETLHYRADGTGFPIEVRAIPLVSENENVLLVVINDISERQQTDDTLKRMKRLYKVLYGVSQVMIQSHDIETIFQQACQIIVDSGQQDMVWIGLVEPDEVSVKPVAAAGTGLDYVDHIKAKVGDPERGIGPIGTSIATNRMIFIEDIATDPRMITWRDNALAHGFVSTASFPITVEGKAVGAFAIYSSHRESFDPQEIELLDKLAGSLALALHMSRADETRRIIETNLHESEHWLTESQKIASIGHYVYEIITNEWVGSEALYSVLGVNTDYMRTLDGWLDLSVKEDRGRLESYFVDEVLGQKKPFDIKYRIMRPSDGTERWVHGLGTVDYAEDGTPIRMFGIIQDIDEHERTVLALEQSERRYSVLAEQGGTAAWEIDTDGLVTYASPVFESVLGYRPDEVINIMHLQDFYQPSNRVEEFVGMQAIIAAGIAFTDIVIHAVNKRGEAIWLSSNGMPVLDAQNTVVAYQGSYTNVTLEKQHEERLRELVQERESHLARLAQSLESTVGVLVRVCEERDPYTAGHQRRVSELAQAIAQQLGLSAQEINDIALAGKIHDVGKIAVPAEILTKPRALTPIELELVHAHAQTSYEIISQAHMPAPIADLIHQHHERCDGSGYPQKLTGNEILFGAKVLMVADVVEAMASHRPYRPAVGIQAALDEITLNASTLYDQSVCDACVEVITHNEFVFSDSL